MKKKFLALALACATLALVIVPSVSAQDNSTNTTPDAEINVTGGYTALTAHGAYDTGISFSFTTADEEADVAADGPLAFASDYLQVRTTNHNLWSLYVDASDFVGSDTGVTYGLANGTADGDNLVLELGAGASEAISVVGTSSCSIVADDLTEYSAYVLGSSAKLVAQLEEDTGVIDGCAVVRSQVHWPWTMDSVTGGFAEDVFKSTVYFTLTHEDGA